MSTTRATTPAPQARGLRELLATDHARLERLFDQLVEAFRADATEEAALAFSRFDEGLQAHLAFEEHHTLPVFARLAPAEAAALAREHEQIRARLTALCVDVDVHLARAGSVLDFVRLLRAHARHEDALMGLWSSAGDAPARPDELCVRWVEIARRLERG